MSLQQVPILKQTLRLIADNKMVRSPYIVLFESTRQAIKEAQRAAEAKYDSLVVQNVVHATISAAADDQSLPGILRQTNLFLPTLEALQSRCHYPDQFSPNQMPERGIPATGGFA